MPNRINNSMHHNENLEVGSSDKITKKNWFYLFSANFFGILNDNFMKHCIVFVAVAWSLPAWMTQAQLIATVAAALVLPYIFFSPLSGKITLLYSKHKIFKICKLLEFPIVILAGLGFIYENITIVLSSVLLMGIQSCMYSPSKYGLIRDIGGVEKISFGNGMFETMSFLAILVGTCLAAWLSDHYNSLIISLLMLLFAAIAYFLCRSIHVTEEALDTDNIGTANPFKFLITNYHYASKHPNVNAGVLGVAVFWMIGGILQSNLILHCTHTLGHSNTAAGIVMALAAIGIASGCTLCGKLCSYYQHKTLITIGLTVVILCLSIIVITNPDIYICSLLIFLTAAFAGCLEVPCLSMIQQAETGCKNGDMLAYMNLISFVFILIGSGLFSIINKISKDNSLMVFVLVIVIAIITLLYFQMLKTKTTSDFQKENT